MKVNNFKKGISLIVLVITIIVVIILASVVILNIDDTNVIDKANESALRQDILAFQIELTGYIDDKKFDAITNGEYYSSSDDALLQNSTTLADIKKVIPGFLSKYVGILSIKNGELYYIGEDKTQDIIKVLNDLNVKYENVY